MSDSSGGLIEFIGSTVGGGICGGGGGGLKRCGGGMSSPALNAGSIGATGGLPRTMSTSALRVRPPRRALFWEQCFDKRDL